MSLGHAIKLRQVTSLSHVFESRHRVTSSSHVIKSRHQVTSIFHIIMSRCHLTCMGHVTRQLNVFDASIDVAAIIYVAASLKLQVGLSYRHVISLQRKKDIAWQSTDGLTNKRTNRQALFLDASSQLYRSVCLSVRPSVVPSGLYAFINKQGK